MPGFWQGGAAAHRKTIRQAHQARLAVLQGRLKCERTAEAKRDLLQAIRAERTWYKQQLAELSKVLY